MRAFRARRGKIGLHFISEKFRVVRGNAAFSRPFQSRHYRPSPAVSVAYYFCAFLTPRKNAATISLAPRHRCYRWPRLFTSPARRSAGVPRLRCRRAALPRISS